MHQSILTKSLFLFFHIVLSLDFGSVNRGSQFKKKVIKLLTVLQSFSVFIISINTYTQDVSTTSVVLGFIILASQYFLNSLMTSLFNRDYSFVDFQETLTAIDRKLSVDSNLYKIDEKIFVFCVLSSSFKTYVLYSFCRNNPEECDTTLFGYIFCLAQEMSYDVGLIMYIFVFYSTYCRVKVLNGVIKNSGSEINELIDVYMNVANATERVKKYFDYIYLSSLMFRTPDLIFTMYAGLMKMKSVLKVGRSFNYTNRIMIEVQNFVLLCSPAVSAGLVTSAVEDLNQTVHYRLLQERDAAYINQLMIFAEYLRARPLKLTVFKVIPLDWTLPVIILNLCISYQIIIVQITNLY